MCHSLLQQQPDGSSKPGLATKVQTPDPRTIVFTINTSVRFWDGKNVTPADVVYSLKRNTNPRLAGFYGSVFEDVTSIDATSDNQVTIKLRRPDNWLLGELSQMPASCSRRPTSSPRARRSAPLGRHDVHRPVRAEVLAVGQRPYGGPQRRLLGRLAEAEGGVDGLQGAPPRNRASPQAC